MTKTREEDWGTWPGSPTKPFSRKTEILFLLLTLLFIYISPAQTASVRLSDIRKGEVQQVVRKLQSQEIMFQPIGDYAMDVNWMHIPFKLNLAKPEEHDEVMLKLYKFVPTPILFNATMGHNVMPKAPNEDYIAFHDDKIFKVLKESELALCRNLGTTYVCHGRTAAMTQMNRSCLGSLISHDFAGIEKHSKLESEATWNRSSKSPATNGLSIPKKKTPRRLSVKPALLQSGFIKGPKSASLLDANCHSRTTSSTPNKKSTRKVDLDFKELPVSKMYLALREEALSLLRNNSIN